MGCYDTLFDGDNSVQVKCFGEQMKGYHPNDSVPLLYTYAADKPWPKKKQMPTYTILLPDYEGRHFALIKDKKFIKLTDNPDETYPPYVSKWGNLITNLEKSFPGLDETLDILHRKAKEEEKDV